MKLDDEKKLEMQKSKIRVKVFKLEKKVLKDLQSLKFTQCFFSFSILILDD